VNPRNVRPKKEWVSVLCDQRKEVLASGIILATETGAEKVTERAGTIVRIGNGEKAPKIGLKEGDRIVFRGYLKHANPIPHDEKWADGTEKEYFLMDIADVFAVIEGPVEVGVYSGRPMNPVMR
jgi:co-chaperonin GroES (HSP10)